MLHSFVLHISCRTFIYFSPTYCTIQTEIDSTKLSIFIIKLLSIGIEYWGHKEAHKKSFGFCAVVLLCYNTSIMWLYIFLEKNTTKMRCVFVMIFFIWNWLDCVDAWDSRCLATFDENIRQNSLCFGWEKWLWRWLWASYVVVYIYECVSKRSLESGQWSVCHVFVSCSCICSCANCSEFYVLFWFFSLSTLSK